MPEARTTHTRGSSTTTTPEFRPPSGGGGGGLGVLGDVIRDRLAEMQRQRRGAQQQAAGGDPIRGVLRAGRPTGGGGFGGGGFNPNSSGLRSAPKRSPADFWRERAAMAEAKALSQPPPTRMVHGAGVIPGRTLDVNAMNAFQRQAYLPQNAQQIQGDPRDMAATQLAQMRNAQRHAQMRGGYGGYSPGQWGGMIAPQEEQEEQKG